MKRIPFFALAWLAISLYGMAVLIGYANTPAPQIKAMPLWPSGSHLIKEAGLPTLVVFLHPKCSCSRATATELEKISAKLNDKKMNILAVFFNPQTPAKDWLNTPVYKKIAAIGRAKILIDNDGAEAERFGAKVSGSTLLYDSTGQLVFRGGITPERGHEGDNVGEDFIVNWFRTGESLAEVHFSQTFGCPIKEVN